MASPKDVEAGIVDAPNSPPPAYNQPGDPDRQHVMTDTPPSYSSTVPTGDMAPPPSYESLYGKVKRAREETDGNVDFCKRVLIIFCSTIGCTIMLGVMLAIPITMIVIGAIHKDDCPAERMIPIYLIVGGVFTIIKNISSLGQRCKNKDDEEADEKNIKTNPFDGVISCFLFAWFIAGPSLLGFKVFQLTNRILMVLPILSTGNVWIYRTYGEWTSDSLKDNYCDPTLYWFAFWVTTATYILIGLSCCCICTVGILSACCSALTGRNEQ